MMASAYSTPPSGRTMPKSSQTPIPVTSMFRNTQTTLVSGGPNSGTILDAGVRKTASSDPRICSCRSAVPGPQRSELSHIYIAYPTKTKTVIPVVPARSANAWSACGSPPPEYAWPISTQTAGSMTGQKITPRNEVG